MWQYPRWICASIAIHPKKPENGIYGERDEVGTTLWSHEHVIVADPPTRHHDPLWADHPSQADPPL